MITKELLNPKQIVVVGGSEDTHKPGGKVLKNLKESNFSGEIFVLNPKEKTVQGIKSYKSVESLPKVELAVIAIASKYCIETVRNLIDEKQCKAFIILSAGFSETNEEGAKIEEQLTTIINKANASLIGPNCIGVLNSNYNLTFTEPIPKVDSKAITFISGSGATAVFILESAIPKGLKFASIYSVGNSAQTSVEDLLEHFDETFDKEKSSKNIMLYLEDIDNPTKLLKHSRSLINKGCQIVAIKAGSSQEGSRAASSHTGALASSDNAVTALFNKAGIVRAFSREELVAISSVFQNKKIRGKNIAIITHAGGPAVMLTDALSKNEMSIPALSEEKTKKLQEKLFHGSSTANPIDFLATGTAEQLSDIIDFCEKSLPEIDAMAVIFGTPGLVEVFDAYEVIDEKMKECKKPIYPILPTESTAKREIDFFVNKNRVYYSDEVSLGNAVAKVYKTNKYFESCKNDDVFDIDIDKAKLILNNNSNGYLKPDKVKELLSSAKMPIVSEISADNYNEIKRFAEKEKFPVVLKVVGPLHKSDVGGVVLNIKDFTTLKREYERLIKIKDAKAVLIQPMIKGEVDLFIGSKYEDKFGQIIFTGLGGFFIELIKDFKFGLAPIRKKEAILLLEKLKSNKLFTGYRNIPAINIIEFAEIISCLSYFVNKFPEIKELDLNPLKIDNNGKLVIVDSRIRIDKKSL